MGCHTKNLKKKLSSTLTSLFNIVLNCKILLFSLLKINDKIMIIIKHLAAKPAQVLLLGTNFEHFWVANWPQVINKC
jgi:hypothetical protein